MAELKQTDKAEINFLIKTHTTEIDALTQKYEN